MSAGDHVRYLKLRSALYDRTTGLPAFPVLFDRVRTWLDDVRSVGVIHLEVEQLALVESLYGWQVLDRILARIAGVLGPAVGPVLPPGTLIGLNGVAGDRFAAFVPRRPDGGPVDGPYLDGLAERLGRLLEEAFAVDDFAGLAPRLGFRLGRAQVTIDPFHRFERRVWAALDEARGAHERREQRRERGAGEDLQRIIRGADLRTLFQPVVDLGSGEVMGFEALARGPESSVFEQPRALFAESDRLGLAIELDHACRDAALSACPPLGAGRKIFLNALPASFRGLPDDRGSWPGRLGRLAGSAGDTVLEFSERAAESDPDDFVDTLRRVKAAGFGVAVDDLGTGFSSQAILDRLRPDFLKLDGSLVRRIEGSLIKQEILRTLVRIAESIGASVIAEGIETEEESRALAEAGARFGQGHLFARPAARIGEAGGRVP